MRDSPATYSHGHHAAVLRSHSWRTAENSAAYLLPHLREDQVLLDVGVGPGTLTADLAARVRRAVGIDSAPAAVQATRALARERGLPGLTVQVGDVGALAFADSSFDVVHAHQVLQHLADPVAALREMRRVCRSGGVVAVREVDHATMTWFPASDLLRRWLELSVAITQRNGGDPYAGRALKGWALAAGAPAQDLTCTASAWCFSERADLAWWSETWAHRLTESTFATSALEHGLSDRAELAALAAGWRAWREQPDAWFGMLHSEVLVRT